MKNEFIELKSTDNQVLFVRREAVNAFEVVPSSQRVEGHIKLYISGFKFLVTTEKDELLKQLNEG